MRRALFAVCILSTILAAPIAYASVDAGFVAWRQKAEMDVTSASDFDGSNETAEERGRNWDTQGSGFGVEVSYRFPRILRLFGELSLAQSIVRFEDISDPARDVRTLALDNTLKLTVGARPEGVIAARNLFWAAGVNFSVMSSGLDQDVQQSWDYDETTFSLDGRFGYLYHQLGFYGGLRFVNYDATLTETDIGQPAGMQQRTIEFDRKGNADILLGVQTRGESIAGLVELGFLSEVSARAGVAYRF